MKFRELKAEEIDVKVGSVTSKGYTLLLYKNARVDMAILDETVGIKSWQNKFYEVCGNLYCSVGIKFDNEWVWKDDCGVESAFGDKEKGQASDARKRAGFVWGIGRELYTAPRIFIPCETKYDENKRVYKIANDEDQKRSLYMSVKEITYTENGDIDKLVIVDNKGVVAFDNSKHIKNDEPEKKQLNQNGGEFVMPSGKHAGKKLKDIDSQYLDWYLENGYSEDIKNQIIFMRKLNNQTDVEV